MSNPTIQRVSKKLEASIGIQQKKLENVRAIESKFKDLKEAVDRKCRLSGDLKALVDQTKEDTTKKLKAAFRSFSKKERNIKAVASVFTKAMLDAVLAQIDAMFVKLLEETTGVGALCDKQRTDELIARE
jgi:hypothetical protein